MQELRRRGEKEAPCWPQLPDQLPDIAHHVEFLQVHGGGNPAGVALGTGEKDGEDQRLCRNSTSPGKDLCPQW